MSGLHVTDLTILQGAKPVVSGASLVVNPGHVTAVLGANGAGKSELCLGIGGALSVAGGSVTVDGADVTGKTPDAVRAAGIAVVPEGHRILDKLTVDENLRVAGALLPASEVTAVADRVYDLFPEMAERKGQIAGTMSGGQQQMLAIGHALMCRPRYLVIDEMSLGLAPLIVQRLVRALKLLLAEGVGILLVEQFTEIALSLATDAVVMRSGKVHYAGPAKQLHDDPAVLDKAYFG
jgi:branched-chain amino acid transport system ATP-binding protein|tara:strand:- start:60470 stop:61177 length:708 start_codon:yes stop_codon:yes gene_type:complete